MQGHRHLLTRTESNYIIKIFKDPAKRNKRIEKAIIKRFENEHKLIDWVRKPNI